MPLTPGPRTYCWSWKSPTGRCRMTARSRSPAMAPSVHGVGGDPELFQRHHAEDGLGAWLAEDDDRRLHAIAHSDADPRHRVVYLPSVREHEGPFLLRHDAQTFQDVPGNPGVRRSSVHERLHPCDGATGQLTHLNGHVKMAHP